jgi:transcriptional regulator with XRE-family HTH domain
LGTVGAAEELEGEDTMLTFFGSELVRLRGLKGVGQSDLAAATHCTQALVSKIENAKRVPSKDFARDADAFFGSDGHLSRLWPLAIKYAYPSWFRPYVDLEKAATVIRSFETMVVPGLLQTREYAHAILAARRTNDIETLLDARLERQAILERRDPPELWAVIDEGALRRNVGDGPTMRQQMQRLLDAVEHPNVVVQVVPSGVGAHAGIGGPFARLAFPEGHKQALPVVYIDGFLRGQILADPADVRSADRAYDLLMGSALSVSNSVDLIANVMKEVET